MFYTLNAGHGGDFEDTGDKSIYHVIAELGLDGWEAYAVINNTIYYMKRPISDTES